MNLTQRSVSHLGDRPLQRQLADVIREAITCGDLRPGEELPAEADMMTDTNLSLSAVRGALRLLATEGLIVKQAGRRTRVAIPPPVRHMATDRYARELAILRSLNPGDPHPATSAFVQDHGATWDEYSVQAYYLEDGAGPDDARHLEIPVGAGVLRRRLLKIVRGQPVQLQDSVMPLDRVRGTAVADPDRQPWPGGTIAELWSIGLGVTGVEEEARARTPTVAERATLDMTTAGPVFDVLRIFHAVPHDAAEAEPVPVEVSTCVLPAAGVIMRWETELPRD